MTIRPARPADADRVAKLLTELDYPTDAAAARRRIESLSARDSFTLLVAVNERDQVVGLAGGQVILSVHSDEPVGLIMAMVVSPSERRHGTGRALVRAIEDALRSRGCTRVMVTSANRRAGAHAFYEAIGYERTGLRFARRLDGDGRLPSA